MSPLAGFLCTLSILLCFNGKFVDSEALPGRSISINDKTPLNFPSSMLSGGSQPAVDSLLANEPNCSRWIWGTCYFNHGMCGEGKQHATRSGDGCRIIGITSRCYKECGKNNATPYQSQSLDDGEIWGIDENNNKEGKPSGKPQPPKFEDPYLLPDIYDRNWAKEGNMYADQLLEHTGISPGTLDSSDEGDDSHCRWMKAAWGPCRGGVKTRVRKLRKNRKQKEGLSCPDQKRDTKACLLSGVDLEAQKKAIGAMGDSLEAEVTRLDETCKWNKETRKCGKCEPQEKSVTCVMPLLSGNPAICGEERKFELDC